MMKDQSDDLTDQEETFTDDMTLSSIRSTTSQTGTSFFLHGELPLKHYVGMKAAVQSLLEERRGEET